MRGTDARHTCHPARWHEALGSGDSAVAEFRDDSLPFPHGKWGEGEGQNSRMTAPCCHAGLGRQPESRYPGPRARRGVCDPGSRRFAFREFRDDKNGALIPGGCGACHSRAASGHEGMFPRGAPPQPRSGGRSPQASTGVAARPADRHVKGPGCRRAWAFPAHHANSRSNGLGTPGSFYRLKPRGKQACGGQGVCAATPCPGSQGPAHARARFTPSHASGAPSGAASRAWRYPRACRAASCPAPAPI